MGKHITSVIHAVVLKAIHNKMILSWICFVGLGGLVFSASTVNTDKVEDTEVHLSRRVEPVTIATAIAVAAAIDVGTTVLKSIDDHFFEDEAKACYWNEWQERDARAKIERTFYRGRFQYDKKTLIFKNGIWFCTYKQLGAMIKHIKLDRPKKPYCKSKREITEGQREITDGQEREITERQIPIKGINIPIYPAVKSAVTLGLKGAKALNDRMDTDAIRCYYKDKAARDRFARKEKTYTYGRMEMYKKSFGIKFSKWYCAWKMPALVDLGHALDGQSCVKHFCQLYQNVCGNESAIPNVKAG